jgi:hypothetical protein
MAPRPIRKGGRETRAVSCWRWACAEFVIAGISTSGWIGNLHADEYSTSALSAFCRGETRPGDSTRHGKRHRINYAEAGKPLCWGIGRVKRVLPQQRMLSSDQPTQGAGIKLSNL